MHCASCSPLQIHHDDEWGTVCYHSFDMAAAHVVCNQLGLKYVVSMCAGGLVAYIILISSLHRAGEH